MPRRPTGLIALVGMFLALSPLLNAKQLAVVTDTANSTTNVTAADLQKIFNLHLHIWADGKPVIIVMRDPSAGEMQLLLHKVLNMSVDQAHAFIQAHKGSIVIADSDDAVIRFVASNRGAVGVIDLYSLTKDVNVLKIDSKLPVEQGYLLRGNEP
jgi:ABC-type phosphate transport system substrate-binding protein